MDDRYPEEELIYRINKEDRMRMWTRLRDGTLMFNGEITPVEIDYEAAAKALHEVWSDSPYGAWVPYEERNEGYRTVMLRKAEHVVRAALGIGGDE